MTLVGWWPLHERSGRANDLSGNGNPATGSSGVRGIAGRGGLTAFSFSGNGGVTTSDSNNLDSPGDTDEITISAWVNPSYGNMSSRGTVCTKRGFYYLQVRSSGEVACYTYNDGGGSSSYFQTTTQLPENQWSHITFTETGGTRTIYIDGAVDATGSYTASIGANNAGYGVGIGTEVSNTNREYDGEICDARIYNRALSDSEVQTLYEMGANDYAEPRSDGVAYYPLDGDATDSWGTNDATNNGASWGSPAIRGQAAIFTSTSSEYINLPGGVVPSTSAFTVSAWAMTTLNESQNHYIFDARGDSEFIFGQDSANPGNFSYWFDGTWYNTGIDISHGAYNHFLITTDGSTATAYLNGAPVHQTSHSMANTTSSTPSIGNYHGGDSGAHWQGEIDDVRIYDYVFTPADVAELYQWGTRGRDLRALTVVR